MQSLARVGDRRAARDRVPRTGAAPSARDARPPVGAGR